MLEGLGNNCCIFPSFFTGMAFGTGSAVAHRAVDTVMGPRTIQHETIPAQASPTNSLSGSDACSVQTKAFQDVSQLFICFHVLDFQTLRSKFLIMILKLVLKMHFLNLLQCLNSYGSDISKCQFYMDMLSECRRNSALSAET